MICIRSHTLHDIDKHFTRIPHRHLKRLSTTGNVFSLLLLLSHGRRLSAAASVRAVRRTVTVTGAPHVGHCGTGPQRRDVAVRGAAVARRRVL